MLGDILFILFIALIIFGVICVFNSQQQFAGGKERKNATQGDVVKDLTKSPRSKSEAVAVDICEKIIGCKMPSINPAWLVWGGKTLELDGYCASKNIALEFSGPLHTKWMPNGESYVSYYQRIVKDIVKRKLCKRRGVLLIVIDMSLPREHWSDYIKSRLYDYNEKLYAKPHNYILIQKYKPFRNKTIEREMMLNDLALAKKL
jgi:hypothetical protein